MQGRRTGTPGNVKGNAYIVSEVQRLGLKPAGDAGGYLQKVPLVSFAVDSSRATLMSGSSQLALWKDYYPYQAQFEVPARPIDGSPLVYIGGPGDSATVPSRESLQGKIVVYNSGATGNNLDAPDLRPAGRLGLISGIMVTGADPVIALFGQVFRTPRIASQAEPRGSSRSHPAAAHHPALGQHSDALREAARPAPARRDRRHPSG